MIQVIHKEGIDLNKVGKEGRYNFFAPLDAEILSVGVQNDIPTVWYVCNPYLSKRTITVFVVPTGGEVPLQGIYGIESRFLGTLLLHADKLVLHIFTHK